MRQWQKGKVVENQHWNGRLCSLRIDVALPEFEAGQFIKVGLPDLDGDLEHIQARPYSFVNAPHESGLEIYFNRVPGGCLSNRLFALEEGDEVAVGNRPTGFMTLSELPKGRSLWLLCTGTALGPFLSMLKTQQPWQTFEKIILVHGVRSADELTYGSLIEKLQQLHPQQLLKLNSVTREPMAGALRKRIPTAITDGELEEIAGLALDAEDSRVMVCGNPTMVAGALEALGAKGLHKHLRREPGQVLQEIYQ
ncbi:MAG: ferredoxin--NADP reductase [Pseudomonadales bacterium]